MPNRQLDVWLHGHRIAQLSEPKPFRLRLDFTDEALDVFGEGSRVMSLALPISRAPITDSQAIGSSRPVSAFIDGLLPEGRVRQHIAALARIAVTDVMGLLRGVGAECAGAIQILADGTIPSDGTIRRLEDAEVERLVADLPTYHLPDGQTPQASLAGIQDKVLLTALPEGGWGWPQRGAASTHIIKPEPLDQVVLPQLIQAEHWALQVARKSGLPAAESRLQTFGGREAIVVTRYDRDSNGARRHQEDFCQSLGLDPQAKYESSAEANRDGTRLSRIARMGSARAVDPEKFRRDLLSALTFNVAIGNGDAHSKNYSLTIDRVGRVALAPLYDTAPTWHLDARYKGTGQVINGKTSLDTVGIDDLVAEARAWRMSSKLAAQHVREQLEQIRAAIPDVEPVRGTERIRESIDALLLGRDRIT